MQHNEEHVYELQRHPIIPAGWYKCPHCGKALFPVRADTRIQHMPFRCKACKHDIEINI